jgi:hypothetical protein
MPAKKNQQNKKTTTTRGKRADKPEADKKPLKPRHEKFAAEYVGNGGNGTEAAQAAFPNQNPASAQVTASRLLTNEQIKARIAERAQAALDLVDNEVIGGLVEEMRGDITQALDDRGKPDFAMVREKGLGHLIKAVTSKTYFTKNGDRVEVSRIEFYSSQAAKVQLCKILGLEQQARENDRDAKMRGRVTRAIERLADRFKIDVTEATRLYVEAVPEHAHYLNGNNGNRH